MGGVGVAVATARWGGGIIVLGLSREGLAGLGLGCGLPFRAGMKRAHREPGRHTPLCVTNQKSKPQALHEWDQRVERVETNVCVWGVERGLGASAMSMATVGLPNDLQGCAGDGSAVGAVGGAAWPFPRPTRARTCGPRLGPAPRPPRTEHGQLGLGGPLQQHLLQLRHVGLVRLGGWEKGVG